MSTVEGSELEWDDDNVDHLARHAITPEEVEELFQEATVRRRGGTDAPDRVRILGRTTAGRYLTLIVQQKESGLIRPFTGWEMRSHERDIYDRQVKD